MKQGCFTEIPYTMRLRKLRGTGLTVIVDEHMGIQTQSDFLEFAVGISMLLDGDVLSAKIRKYHEHDVMVFPGGQLLEYVIARNKTQEYFAAVKEAG